MEPPPKRKRRNAQKISGGDSFSMGQKLPSDQVAFVFSDGVDVTHVLHAKELCTGAEKTTNNLPQPSVQAHRDFPGPLPDNFNDAENEIPQTGRLCERSFILSMITVE